MSKQIVLVAGGTGGHVFPALALGQELLNQGYGVYVFTDSRGQSYSWDSRFEVRHIPSTQMRDSILNVVKGVLGIFTGLFKARVQLKTVKPAAVVGFGGYATLTTMFAASSLGIPTMIHQGDALLGRVNRVLAPFMKAIATSFQRTFRIKPSFKNKVIFTGLPLREGIAYEPYTQPKETLNILVIGGSQGAKFFGDVLPDAVKLLPRNHQKTLQIVQQCRSEFLDSVQKKYSETDAKVQLKEFFEDMPERYKWAHLVLSRAGASSVLEIAAVGRPAIFVPYPYATDDHQSINARNAVDVGGAWCFQQKDLTPEKLADRLKDFLAKPNTLAEAAENIRQISRPHGERSLTSALKDLIRTYPRRELAA